MAVQGSQVAAVPDRTGADGPPGPCFSGAQAQGGPPVLSRQPATAAGGQWGWPGPGAGWGGTDPARLCSRQTPCMSGSAAKPTSAGDSE